MRGIGLLALRACRSGRSFRRAQGLAAYLQIVPVALRLWPIRPAQTTIAVQRPRQGIGSFGPLAVAGQGHAKVAQGKSRVLMAFAQQALPQGQGLPVQVNAFPCVAMLLAQPGQIVQAGPQFRIGRGLDAENIPCPREASLGPGKIPLPITGCGKVQQGRSQPGRTGSLGRFAQPHGLLSQSCALPQVALLQQQMGQILERAQGLGRSRAPAATQQVHTLPQGGFRRLSCAAGKQGAPQGLQHPTAHGFVGCKAHQQGTQALNAFCRASCAQGGKGRAQSCRPLLTHCRLFCHVHGFSPQPAVRPVKDPCAAALHPPHGAECAARAPRASRPVRR